MTLWNTDSESGWKLLSKIAISSLIACVKCHGYNPSGGNLLSGVLDFSSFVSLRHFVSAEYLGFNLKSVNNKSK